VAVVTTTYAVSISFHIADSHFAHSRVAQLEQRLDSLTTLLASAQKTPSSNDEQSPNSGSRSRSAVPQISQDVDSPLSLQQSGLLHNIELREGLTSTLMRIDPSRSLKTPTTTNSCLFIPHPQTLALDPNDSEAERLLDLFRTECTPYFPIIHISTTKTARDLRQDCPFLWKVIVMITSTRTPSRQSALCKNIMEEISTRLLLKGEKTLELLQGILLFTAWYVTPSFLPTVVPFSSRSFLQSFILPAPYPSAFDERY
jgi:hypothetical protein